MCRADWALVPKGLRDQVWAAWRSGAGAGSPEYLQATQQAISAVPTQAHSQPHRPAGPARHAAEMEAGA